MSWSRRTPTEVTDQTTPMDLPPLAIEEEYDTRVAVPPGEPDNDMQCRDLHKAKNVWKVLHISAALALKEWNGGTMPTISPTDCDHLLALADAVFTGRTLPPGLCPLEQYVVAYMKGWMRVFYAHYAKMADGVSV